MKKLLFFFISFLLLSGANAQVIFCPPGAEWNYSFGASPTHIANEKISYYKDSVVGLETFKVLLHTRFYNNCNPPVSPILTLIKQKGDTIFLRNSRTQNTWQILFNFNVQANQSWQTTILDNNNIAMTHTITIDSVSFVTINNVSLKRLYVWQTFITERLGWDLFLFNFEIIDPSCHGDNIGEPLCYKDNSFGLKQFTALSCDYDSWFMNIKEYDSSVLKLYPNPTSGNLIFQFNNQSQLINCSAAVTNLLGEEVVSRKEIVEPGENKLDLTDLKNGVYFLKIYDKAILLETKKIIKQ